MLDQTFGLHQTLPYITHESYLAACDESNCESRLAEADLGEGEIHSRAHTVHAFDLNADEAKGAVDGNNSPQSVCDALRTAAGESAGRRPPRIYLHHHLPGKCQIQGRAPHSWEGPHRPSSCPALNLSHFRPLATTRDHVRRSIAPANDRSDGPFRHGIDGAVRYSGVDQ